MVLIRISIKAFLDGSQDLVFQRTVPPPVIISIRLSLVYFLFDFCHLGIKVGLGILTLDQVVGIEVAIISRRIEEGVAGVRLTMAAFVGAPPLDILLQLFKQAGPHLTYLLNVLVLR